MKTFTVNIHNIKQAIGIQVTVISEIELQKEHFLANYDEFFWRIMHPI